MRKVSAARSAVEAEGLSGPARWRFEGRRHTEKLAQDDLEAEGAFRGRLVFPI